MADYTQFNSIISKAITDFDAIFDALRNKSVKYSSEHADLNANTTGVKTEEYAGLITDQLFRVADVFTQSGVVHSGGVIANYAGQTKTLTGTAPDITYSGANVTIEVPLNDAGYYNSNSKVSKTLSTSPVTLSGALSKSSTTPYAYAAGAEEGDLGSWVVAPAEDTILGTVTIAEGSLSIAIDGANAASTSITNTLSSTIASGIGIGASVSLEAPAGDDYYAIQINEQSDVSSTTTVTPSVNFSAGYISSIPTIGETEYAPVSATQTGSTTIYLPKGSIAATASGGGLTVTNTDSLNYTTSASSEDAKPANTYEITVDAAAATITGTTTHGWVADGSNVELASVSAAQTRIFVAEGTVPDNTVTASLSATSASIPVNSEDEDAYEISVARTTGEAAVTTTAITAGYVKDPSYTTTLNITPLTLKVAKGTAAITNALSSVTYTDASNISTTVTPSTAGSYYTIVPKVTTTSTVNASGTKSGYLDSGANGAITSNALSNVEGNPLYILKGAIRVTHALSTTSGSGTILTTSQPSGTEGTDYYKIESTCSTSVTTAGYVASTDDITEVDAAPYYIPKATFSYVQDSTAGNFIQVTSGGYVPSGTISAVSGSLDAAAAVATLSGTPLTTTASSGAYAITISKNTTSTNAGYFSGTEGTLALDATYYVAKGAVVASPVIDSLTFGSVTKVAGSGSNPTTYTVLATATGKNREGTEITVTPGYITAADVTDSDIADKTATLTLDQAVLTVTSGSATLGGTATGVETVSSSAYYVTPTLSGASIQAGVSSAGYVDTTVTSASGSEITVGTTNPVYIKAGTTSSITAANNIVPTLADNLSQSVAGDYTVTASGTASISGTLASGYYPANHSITASGTMSATKTIAHGHATVNATGAEVSFNSSGMAQITNNQDADAHYYTVTASATGVTLSKSGSTTGYIKSSDDTDWTLGTTLSTNNSNSFKIKRYEWNGDGSANAAVGYVSYTPSGEATAQNVYDPTGTGITDDFIVHAAESYSDKNILVRLSPNAAGTNVVADLTRLQNRLNGDLVRA